MLTVGMIVGDRYEIINKIGAGGMSDVYKAKDHKLGRFVAIKVLKAEFSEDVNFVTKFRTEAQSAAGLEHPNIVNIYDVGSESGMHYIIMEYVEGITLKTYIEKKGQLTFKETVSIAIQVGRGIEAAHNKGIIHRDIKPQNIIISTEGKVKVTDFGIARAATSNTINSDVMGSVHYASPEQARNGFVDGKSDIYSLGIVMYEMVTGRVPFDGDTTVAVAIQHLQEEMVSPSAYAPNLPISLEKIILKCTQKNPDRRYESMTALLADLRKSLISPDEDFVVMVPVSQEKTRVIKDDEVQRIKRETNNIYMNEEALMRNALKEDDEPEEEIDDEDDDDDELNPKMDKAITIMGIVAGIVIVALIIFILVSFFGDFSGSNSGRNTESSETESSQEVEGIQVPSLTGKTYDEARAILNELGLGIKSAGTVSSDEYEEGQIVSQDPEADERVEENTTIEVTTSSGKGEKSVINVVGKTSDEAVTALETDGFEVDKQFDFSDTVPQDIVISQTPSANSLAKEGDTIIIVVSRGAETPATVTVPKVTGMTEEQARIALEAAGLSLGNVATEYNNNIAASLITYQSVDPETQVSGGTEVNVRVSLGPEILDDPEASVMTMYRVNLTITAPSSDIVASANIYLYDGTDGSGNILETWTGQSIALFGADGLSLSKTGMFVSSGSVKVDWMDASGNVLRSQVENISFQAE